LFLYLLFIWKITVIKTKKMKKLFLTLGLILPLVMSCKKEGCTDPLAINYSEQAQKDDGTCSYDFPQENYLIGNISENTTLTSDKIWTLGGRVTVVNGVTLTIEPGTIIKGEGGSGANAAVLIIARGGKLMAEGTADLPIIFTSVADEIEVGGFVSPNLEPDFNGLWGGLIICGNAPISADADAVQIEGIPASDQNGLYGGNNPADNSGVLRYISIRHGGANIGSGNEINGLTLGGVGNGTTIEHIEVVGNQDDGIEFFGGTVNVSNTVVWNAGDDSYDVDQSWAGTLNNWIEIGAGDHALELDGAEGTLVADFSLTNGTFISVDSVQCHFRAGAIGYVSYEGLANVEADAGTNVVVDILTTGADKSVLSWTLASRLGKF
jgi:hypothetical protein